MGAGSSVDMADGGLPGGPPAPGADAAFDALVEAEMRQRGPAVRGGPPLRGADPAFDAMVEQEMARQRAHVKSYAATNAELYVRDDGAAEARIREAVGRASGRRPEHEEPAPQYRPPAPTGDPRRDAQRAYAAELRAQMAAPKTSLRAAWGYDALHDDDALRSPPRKHINPQSLARHQDPQGQPVDPLRDAVGHRAGIDPLPGQERFQQPRFDPQPPPPSPRRLARERYAADLEAQMRERQERDRAARLEHASPPRRAVYGAFPGADKASPPRVGAFPGQNAAPRQPEAFSPPMKEAADHALRGRRDARARHVGDVYGQTGVASAAFDPHEEAPSARITVQRDGQEGARRSRALEHKAMIEEQMRANREAKEAADRKIREEDAADEAKWAAKEAEDRRVKEEGERAKKQAEKQRMDDLYAQQEADAQKRRNRRHDERTTPLRGRSAEKATPLRSPPRSPAVLAKMAPASPPLPAHRNKTPPASPPLPSLAAQRVPAALVRAAAPGAKIADDDLERAASDFEQRVAAELARFQGDRHRRAARRAAPANAGGALEALSLKIQAAPDLRTLAGLPPAAPRADADSLSPARHHISAEDDWGETSLAGESTFVPLPDRVARAEAAFDLADTPRASAGALSPDAIADRWQRDHPLPGAKVRRGPARRRTGAVEQSLAGESSFHAFIDAAADGAASPAPPETFDDLADRIPDESFDFEDGVLA